MLQGDSWHPTPEDIPEPSHGRVFCEKFRSAYVVKGVWSLLTDLFLNRCLLQTDFHTCGCVSFKSDCHSTQYLYFIYLANFNTHPHTS